MFLPQVGTRQVSHEQPFSQRLSGDRPMIPGFQKMRQKILNSRPAWVTEGTWRTNLVIRGLQNTVGLEQSTVTHREGTIIRLGRHLLKSGDGVIGPRRPLFWGLVTLSSGLGDSCGLDTCRWVWVDELLSLWSGLDSGDTLLDPGTLIIRAQVPIPGHQTPVRPRYALPPFMSSLQDSHV